MVQRRERELLEVIRALLPPGRFTGCLNGGQQQRHQNANDRYDNQQLNQGKTTPCRIRSHSYRSLSQCHCNAPDTISEYLICDTRMIRGTLLYATLCHGMLADL
jgi:hypothetical protein